MIAVGHIVSETIWKGVNKLTCWETSCTVVTLNVNEGRKKMNKCKELKNKLNLTVSVAMMCIVIKKQIGNGTCVSCTISKNATT